MYDFSFVWTEVCHYCVIIKYFWYYKFHYLHIIEFGFNVLNFTGVFRYYNVFYLKKQHINLKFSNPHYKAHFLRNDLVTKKN